MEIYGSLGNANVINIYLQHVLKWPSCPRFAFKIKYTRLKRQNTAIQNLLCGARAHADFFSGGGFSVTLVEDFFNPTVPSPLSKYLSLCMPVPR